MNDMRQLLEVAKADAPPVRVSVDDIVRAGQRRVRHRWYARAAGVACGVAAVVLAAASVLPADHPAESGPVGSVAVAPAPLFAFTFSGYAVGDYRVGDPLEVTPGYQRADITQSNVDVGDGPPVALSAGTLTVYRPGAFRPDTFLRDGKPVTVRGREGRAAVIAKRVLMAGPERSSRLNPTERVVDVPALAWQYAGGAWATIEASYLAERTMTAGVQRQLAERFTTRVPLAAKVPVRVTHLPDGWRLGSAGAGSLVAGDTSVALLRFVPAATDFGGLTGPLDLDANPAAIRITVAPVETEGPYPHPFDPPCPAGQHFCDVKIDARYYAEVHDQSGTLSDAQVRAVADGLRFATVADKGSWFAVTG